MSPEENWWTYLVTLFLLYLSQRIEYLTPTLNGYVHLFAEIIKIATLEIVLYQQD